MGTDAPPYLAAFFCSPSFYLYDIRLDRKPLFLSLSLLLLHTPHLFIIIADTLCTGLLLALLLLITKLSPPQLGPNRPPPELVEADLRRGSFTFSITDADAWKDLDIKQRLVIYKSLLVSILEKCEAWLLTPILFSRQFLSVFERTQYCMKEFILLPNHQISLHKFFNATLAPTCGPLRVTLNVHAMVLKLHSLASRFNGTMRNFLLNPHCLLNQRMI